MALHNQSEAAKLVGVTRQTIINYCKKGKLAYKRDRQGNPKIETSELMRVFGELKQEVQEPEPTSEELAALKRLVEEQSRKLDKQSKQIEELTEQVKRLDIIYLPDRSKESAVGTSPAPKKEISEVERIANQIEGQRTRHAYSELIDRLKAKQSTKK